LIMLLGEGEKGKTHSPSNYSIMGDAGFPNQLLMTSEKLN
jgi:hypothetical protein